MEKNRLTFSEELGISVKKKMFVVFFNVRGVILTHAVPLGETVNAAYYTKVSLLISIQTNNNYFTGFTIDDFKFIPGVFRFICYFQVLKRDFLWAMRKTCTCRP